MGRKTHQTQFRRGILSCANTLVLSRCNCGDQSIFSIPSDDDDDEHEHYWQRRFDNATRQLRKTASSTSTSSTYDDILDAEEYISKCGFDHSTGPSAQYENQFNAIPPIRFKTTHNDIREVESLEKKKSNNNNDDEDIDTIRRELEEFINSELKEFKGAGTRRATSEERISSKLLNQSVDMVVSPSFVSASTQKVSNRKMTTHERVNSPRYHSKLPSSKLPPSKEKKGFLAFAPISKLFRSG
mmetsp:Transcript_16270/g.34376  ORF Transcript_16270/g.34376 Transcript_16270/m.34376 type:complete len:242 (+) Transcript_16270:201-926(+)